MLVHERGQGVRPPRCRDARWDGTLHVQNLLLEMHLSPCSTVGRLAAGSYGKLREIERGQTCHSQEPGGPNETDPNTNRQSLVQVDACGSNVALARPVRMPEVRAAAPGLLGTPGGGRPAQPVAHSQRRQIHSPFDSSARYLLTTINFTECLDKLKHVPQCATRKLSAVSFQRSAFESVLSQTGMSAPNPSAA